MIESRISSWPNVFLNRAAALLRFFRYSDTTPSTRGTMAAPSSSRSENFWAPFAMETSGPPSAERRTNSSSSASRSGHVSAMKALEISRTRAVCSMACFPFYFFDHTASSACRSSSTGRHPPRRGIPRCANAIDALLKAEFIFRTTSWTLRLIRCRSRHSIDFHPHRWKTLLHHL